MNELRLNEPVVIIEPHADSLIVGTGVEFDLRILGKVGVTISGQVEEIPKRWHCTGFAGNEEIAELSFGCKTQDAAPDFFAQNVQIYGIVRRKDGHDQP